MWYDAHYGKYLAVTINFQQRTLDLICFRRYQTDVAVLKTLLHNDCKKYKMILLLICLEFDTFNNITLLFILFIGLLMI